MSSSEPKRGLSEFAMIATLFAPLAAKAEGAYRLRDDAATLSVSPGKELVLTVDTIVEGVHFLKSDPADFIARKALRVNLSDLAAKGATASGYLLALSLPVSIDDAWLTLFAAGLREDQEYFGLSLMGGDTTSTPGPLTISITAIGEIPKGQVLRRGGARPGDCVFVSGTIGDSGAGLDILRSTIRHFDGPHRDELLRRYHLPEPRLSLGKSLIGLASAALDVSDGLIADLGHISDVSKVRIIIDAGKIPISQSCRALWGSDLDCVLRASTSGDDYEIAFTAPEQMKSEVLRAASDAGVAVCEIGRVEEGSGVVLLDPKGQEISVKQPGFTHF